MPKLLGNLRHCRTARQASPVKNQSGTTVSAQVAAQVQPTVTAAATTAPATGGMRAKEQGRPSLQGGRGQHQPSQMRLHGAHGQQLQQKSGARVRYASVECKEMSARGQQTQTPAPRTPEAALRTARAQSLPRGRMPSKEVKVTIIAPGAGTGANAEVYRQLDCSADFKTAMVGRSGAVYDRYPASWRQGVAGQNLESFTREHVLAAGVVENSDCLIVGSRGGQVVLPHLWKTKGAAVPPAVVINGGCAMKLPAGDASWPKTAVTFLLIGGQDTFRGSFPVKEYLAETKRHVPRDNRTTAILYVNEMKHMPQTQLLSAVLQPMLRTILAWNSCPQSAPLQELREVMTALGKTAFKGSLSFTDCTGAWQDWP